MTASSQEPNLVDNFFTVCFDITMRRKIHLPPDSGVAKNHPAKLVSFLTRSVIWALFFH